MRSQSGGTSLAMTLLDNVKIQLIDKFFKELTMIANFSVGSAWKLIGRCLSGFFQAMVVVCLEMALVEEVRTRDTKAQMIWTITQCHTIVDQFVILDFKGHTTMLQQMTLYMMTEWVHPTQMIKLVSTIEGGHKAMQDAVKQVKQLVKTIDKSKATSKQSVGNPQEKG
jgi:hypothetical protein